MSDLTCKACNFKNKNPNDLTGKTFVCSFNPPKPFPIAQQSRMQTMEIQVMSIYPTVDDKSPACSNFLFNTLESPIKKV